jgi:hypothetical protein
VHQVANHAHRLVVHAHVLGAQHLRSSGEEGGGGA